ncbi:putative MFS multidrug transporter [Paraphoma chrysanthemicola]|uniref:MFS multidrug transporter n=1 Tax=Paraphoma chrysanthemicola TaxID=798071 RepID=A0A8K0RAN8_9PLEO|nr:putative MFS multidrug transporter [Paraphoma chrysanthemicola]
MIAASVPSSSWSTHRCTQSFVHIFRNAWSSPPPPPLAKRKYRLILERFQFGPTYRQIVVVFSLGTLATYKDSPCMSTQLPQKMVGAHIPEEKSKVSIEAALEKGVADVPCENIDAVSLHASPPAASNTGDRIVVLMDLDKGLVGWEDENDPENPLNWTKGKKWLLMTWIILMTTFSPMTSSFSAPGTGLTMAEFGVTSKSVGTIMNSIFVLGFALGPLILAPLSELYGRPIVINCSCIFYNAFLLGCSFAPNMPSLIIMRLLAGLGGSAPMTIVSAIIGDTFRLHERAAVSAIVIGMPALAPVVGPILGGFVSQSLGWRWPYWILIMVTIPLNILMFLFMQESNHPSILERKTRRLRKELGRNDLRSQLELQLPPREVLARSLMRPMKFLCKSPIIFIIAMYISTIYGILYLMLTTIPDVFQTIYDFEIQYTGLVYIGLGLGLFISNGLILVTNDKMVVRLREKNGGIFEPEMRLGDCIYYTPFMPLSLFIYGWTTRASVHWIVPCLALILFGISLSGVFVPCQTYAVDAFPETAASAVSALVVTRSAFGAFLPLVGPAVYDSLGLGMGNTVLGILALVVTPAPFAIFKWGGAIRKRWPVKL